MPNRWTGNFDVVVQAGLRAVSSFLSVHHKEGRYPHSLRYNLPLRPAGHAGRWTTDPSDLIGVGSGRRGRRRGPRPPRGLLEMQIGSPRLVVPRRPTDSRITIDYPIVAHFTRVPGSGPAPDSSQFRLHATVDVEQVVEAGESVLEVALGAEDVDLAFVPSPGVPTRRGESQAVLRMARSVLRSGIEPVNMVVETGGEGDFAIHHWRFKLLYGREVPVVATLVNLGERAPRAGDRDGVSEVFVTDPQGMAIALGREFITTTMSRMAGRSLDGLRFGFDVDGLLVPMPPTRCDMRFNVDPETATLELAEGRLRVRISGQVRPTVRDSRPDIRAARRVCQRIFSSFGFTITQDMSLELDGLGRLQARAQGDPSISTTQSLLDSLLDSFSSRIRTSLAAPMRQIEAAASAGLQEMLVDVEGLVREGLQLPGAAIRWTDVEIDPEGVILQASPSFPNGFPEPVVRFTTRLEQIPTGGAVLELDAFSSWIPGGRVSRYRWRSSGWAYTELDRVQERGFLARVDVPDPPGGVAGWPPARWTLDVSGYQPDIRGVLLEVTGNGSAFASLEPPGVGRADFRQLKLAVMNAKGKVAGIYSPWRAAKPRATTAGAYLLVHFAGQRASESLRLVQNTLEGLRASAPTTLPVVVLPGGALPNRTLVGIYPAFAWAEDRKLDWRRRFRPRNGESTFLLDPKGDLLWRRSGPVDKSTLDAALEEHLQPIARAPVWRHPRGVVRPSRQAPDFLFELTAGRRVPLRRFRGREVILVFWTTWADGCLNELRKLDAKARAIDSKKLLVLAINDGEPAGKAAAFLRRNGISLRLVADPEGKISRLFEIKDWPTTFTIDGKGKVRSVSHGTG